ncbi:23S rRNA (adenine(2030)-N(6))-methyltransferase RlmJ [Corticimicrobacter populi]|uniref:Ribosomal RNA large subunit methyltransferase J n=1 Tax=Corticimicrobacter populi TaxID=2175229 RepID=A0A2V1K530_9BURK|nr:23S rRNA (adenine(2030)-N(6))-methyltransferase RlmJ [Corticimicrobacter populi]PWF25343.1 23S rRNA (adenine(2030)-N(6))-methyltransferase RlmJ [Corticimicrobacter populi]
MFSYRHAFHAGNHADVLKHAILVQVLDYLNRKDAAYWVIDTHAGAGMYALDGDWAGQTAEYEGGVGRLWSLSTDAQQPQLISRYLDAIRLYNQDGQLRYYPGSPWLTLDALRPHDRLRLFELHPTEQQVLSANLREAGRAAQRQVSLQVANGFDGLKALLPVPTRRSLVLIDPSYENKQDYASTLHAVQEGLQRAANGVFAVWYPLVSRREAHDLPRKLMRLPVKSWLNATLSVQAPSPDGRGLYGSGMFLINPPWTLAEELKTALPWLARTLAQDGRAGWTLESA